MSRGEEFEELRPLLFAIAYRMVAEAEAEDAVQDAWLLSGPCTELSREGLRL